MMSHMETDISDNLISWPEAASLLRSGQLVVGPTDTVYGVLADALNKEAVEQVYEVKSRPADKPLIVLVADTKDITDYFHIKLTAVQTRFLAKLWPARASVLLPAGTEFTYIHRGTENIAFRMPDHKELRRLLQTTGPLVAPSANISEQPPATDVLYATKEFGSEVSGYIDGGEATHKSSTVLKLNNGDIKILRPGPVTRETLESYIKAD